MKIMIINGPNLNMLGVREPQTYGNQTLETINHLIESKANEMGIAVDFYQSNCEGELISKIHSLRGQYDGLILNAGAYTHYSFAIADAIPIAEMPVIEVHMSNIFQREDFRHTSVISHVCTGSICGFGSNSYLLALDALKNILENK